MEKYFKKAPVEMVDLWRQFEACHRIHSIQVGASNWQYISAGSGKRPLLLLPGEELFAEFWFRLILAMEKKRALLAITLPALESIQDHTNGLAGMLDSLGIGQVDLLGASMGGCIAQEFTRRFPQRVRCLVLANSYSPGCRDPRLSRIAEKIYSRLPTTFLRASKKQHLLGLAAGTGREGPFWKELSGMVFDRYLASAGKQTLLAPVRTLASFSRYDHYGPRDLVNWPGRVMIIESASDPGAGERCQSRLRLLYPQATVNTLSNTGHTPGYSMPVDFSVLVGSFL